MGSPLEDLIPTEKEEIGFKENLSCISKESTLRGLNPPDNGELGDYYPDGSSLSAVPIGISSCLLEEELDFVELGFITVAHGQTSAHGQTLAHGQAMAHGQTIFHRQTLASR